MSVDDDKIGFGGTKSFCLMMMADNDKKTYFVLFIVTGPCPNCFLHFAFCPCCRLLSFFFATVALLFSNHSSRNHDPSSSLSFPRRSNDLSSTKTSSMFPIFNMFLLLLIIIHFHIIVFFLDASFKPRFP